MKQKGREARSQNYIQNSNTLKANINAFKCYLDWRISLELMDFTSSSHPSVLEVHPNWMGGSDFAVGKLIDFISRE